MLAPLTTQIVGSYSKPTWLLHRDRTFRLDGSQWRLDGETLAEAKRDAARLAIYDQERAGLDMVTDGEAQRAAYDHHFYTRFHGVEGVVEEEDNPRLSEVPTVIVDDDRTAELAIRKRQKPRIVSKLGWPGPITLDEVRFAKAQTDRPLKTTVHGPITAYIKLADAYYHNEAAAIDDLAAVVNAEMLSIDQAGLSLIQLDEPILHGRLAMARPHAVRAVERALRDVKTPVALHMCYGYAWFRSRKSVNSDYGEALALAAACPSVSAISLEYEQPGHEPDILVQCGDKHVILGLLNLGTQAIETPEHIAARLRAALKVIPAERLHPSSDCGLWHLPRDVAFGKICALAEGTRIVRREIGL